MEFGERLRALRLEQGWSQPELAERMASCGCTASFKAVSRWELGYTEPGIRQFLCLCELFGVRDVQEVFCGRPGPLQALNGAGRRRVEEYIRLLAGDRAFSAAPPAEPQSLRRSLPLYELPVSAGTGQFLDRTDYTLLEVDETVPLSATFAVRISGDSMTPRFVHRQIVYVRQQQTLEPGEIGIFVLEGDAYCKQLGRGKDGGTVLLSLNRQYAPIPVGEYSELRVLGKVVS